VVCVAGVAGVELVDDEVAPVDGVVDELVEDELVEDELVEDELVEDEVVVVLVVVVLVDDVVEVVGQVVVGCGFGWCVLVWVGVG
jgi:hypothetical protein